jgi:hypothetical protein
VPPDKHQQHQRVIVEGRSSNTPHTLGKRGVYRPVSSGSELDLRDAIQTSLANTLRSADYSTFDIEKFTGEINTTITQDLWLNRQFPNIVDQTAALITLKGSSNTYSSKETLVVDSLKSDGSSDHLAIQRYSSAISTLLGTARYKSTTTSRRKHTKVPKQGVITSLRSLNLYPSRMLTTVGIKHGMDINMSIAETGWNFSLNPIRAVPETSFIFDCCRTGNIDAVRMLISKGEASVMDTSPKGWTPLHVSHDEDKISPPSNSIY